MGSELCSTPIHAAELFEGDVRSRIVEWKFHHRTGTTRYLAALIVSKLKQAKLSPSIDVVTWAPTSSHRRRRRGYDQAELLARSVARQLRLPCRRLLIRKSTHSQTGRTRNDRLIDPPRFVARPMRVSVRVLVIDDVVTTGSTLRSALAALEFAGYSDVVLAAVCSTPNASEPRQQR